MGLFIKVITIEDVIKELHPSTFGALELCGSHKLFYSQTGKLCCTKCIFG